MTKMNLQLFAVNDETKKKLQATAVNNPTGQKSTLTNNTVNLKGVDSGLINTINTTFNTSAAYNQAMTYTNELLQKLNTGKTSYTDQIKELMGTIQNRPKFEYDVDSDPLFQQALSSAMSSGKTAMQDTIGQASALTGGYGSTYATSAGNQQYNAFIQDAYDNLPEYYQMAMQAYQMEGDELYNQLGMLSTADATEYQRMYDAWGANFSNTQQMYQNEYQKWSDEISNAFNLAGMQNTDWWNTTNFNEQQRQYNASLAEQQRQHNETLAEQQRQFNEEMKYKKTTTTASGNTGTKSSDLKEPTTSQYEQILKILNNDGEDAMYKYVDSLGDNINVDAINNYINKYGRGNINGRTFSVISPAESERYAGKVNYGVIRDQYGNDYTLEEIKAIDKNAYEKLKNLKKGQKVTIG